MRLGLPRKLGVSFSTVWRRAEQAGIELTAGREAKGYKRLSPEQSAQNTRGAAGQSDGNTRGGGASGGREPSDREPVYARA